MVCDEHRIVNTNLVGEQFHHRISSMIRPNLNDFLSGDEKITVIGLGYVGLPLAHLLASKFEVVGFDINTERVNELQRGIDRTRELTREQLVSSALRFSTDESVLDDSRFIIVTVPTPIDAYKKPDLRPLIGASTMIGRHIQSGTTVVFESTVYPGCTEEDCLPLIEQGSGLKWRTSFFAGYSPERINPGDKEHSVAKIKKVVSGDGPETIELVRGVYSSVITAGTFVAASIKTAEAAKVIENTQRDLNIALMNELALIFDRMGLRTHEVLEAAGTKWNFLPFSPGLVGGHCIGVDPYYLTQKAEVLGYHPQVILAGRRINDGMGKFIAEKAVKLLINENHPIKGSRVLILGWTFKENVPDIRNTRVVDIYRELVSYGLDLTVYDSEADGVEVLHEYGVEMAKTPDAAAPYVAVIVAVKHNSFRHLLTIEHFARLGGGTLPLIVDVKAVLTQEFGAWQL